MKKVTFIVSVFLLWVSLAKADEFSSEFDDDSLIESSIHNNNYIEMKDPLFPVNRVFYKTYKFGYTYFLKYAGETYSHTPIFFRERVNSFVTNLGEPRNFISHLLQGRINAASESLFRFIFNSSFGFLGLFDIMEAVGMPNKYNDIGAVLYFYGIPDGPYVTFLGPSNLRDFTSIVFFSSVFDPLSYQNYIYQIRLYGNISVSYGAIVATLNSANLYTDYSFYFQDSLDEYSAIKSFYADYRRNQLKVIAGYK